jgi:hypothetical protein
MARRRHLRIRATGGGIALARCEDGGCTVAPDGTAGCCRLACPACGCGGSNVSEDPDREYRCTCGHTWGAAVPELELEFELARGWG